MKTLSQHIQEKLTIDQSWSQNDPISNFVNSKQMYIIRLKGTSNDWDIDFDIIYDCDKYKDPACIYYKKKEWGGHYKLNGLILIDYMINYDVTHKRYELDKYGDVLYNVMMGSTLSQAQGNITLILPEILKENFKRLVERWYSAVINKETLLMDLNTVFINYLKISIPSFIQFWKKLLDIDCSCGRSKDELNKVYRNIK